MLNVHLKFQNIGAWTNWKHIPFVEADGTLWISVDSLVRWEHHCYKTTDNKRPAKVFNVRKELGRHVGAGHNISGHRYEFTSFLRYIFQHHDDFDICRQLCRDVAELIQQKLLARSAEATEESSLPDHSGSSSTTAASDSGFSQAILSTLTPKSPEQHKPTLIWRRLTNCRF